jgi:hypothetical protein
MDKKVYYIVPSTCIHYTSISSYFFRSVQKARVLHYTKLEMFVRVKHPILLGLFTSYKEYGVVNAAPGAYPRVEHLRAALLW